MWYSALLYSNLNYYNFLKWFHFCNNVQIVLKKESNLFG